MSCFITGQRKNDNGPILDQIARRSSSNMENPVGPGSSFLLGSYDVGTRRRLLESVIKVEVRMAAGDIAQDHEEGVMGKLPGLGRKTLNHPLFMCLQLLDQ